MTAAAPRKKEKGEASMRPYRIGTSSGTRDSSCAASTSRAGRRSSGGVHSRWLERATCFRASFPRATESVTATPRDWQIRVARVRGWPIAVLMLVALLAAASPASARVTFYFGLERPEGAARAAWSAVGNPSSSTYRQFSSQAATAKRYGARPATIRRFKRAVRRHGLRARVDRSRVFARVSGSVRRFERVLGVRIRKQFNNDVFANIWFAAGKRPPRLPRDLRPVVREVVASYSRSTRSRRRSAGLRTGTEGRSASYAVATCSGTSISRLRILPVGPLGSSSRNQTRRGYLYAATWSLT
jgi:hypothetical protein